jgi:hypothetical protein
MRFPLTTTASYSTARTHGAQLDLHSTFILHFRQMFARRSASVRATYFSFTLPYLRFTSHDLTRSSKVFGASFLSGIAPALIGG